MTSAANDALALEFESHRTHLRAVAYRMLGSVHEADDAVQESWLRLARTDATTIDNLAAWLTTVVSRICLDHLRARRTDAHERPVVDDSPDPELEALLAEQVGEALQVVLDTLSPGERLAFVLHDLFGLPFDEVAQVTGRSSTAVRQLASRGRRKVRAEDGTGAGRPATQRRVVEAFLAASRGGDLAALVAMLDPEAVVSSDPAAVAMGSEAVVSGVDAVAEMFSGRARAALLADIDGYAGATWSRGGQLLVAFAFTLEGDRIREIELIADPETLATLDVTPAVTSATRRSSH